MKNQVCCKLCGSIDVSLVFTESSKGKDYSSYYCKHCDLFQTLGDIAPVSPDYVELENHDLDQHHIFLQTLHKYPAFKQWNAIIRSVKRVSQINSLNENVLDVGCGIGGFLDYAQSQKLNVYGFDASESQVAEAIKRHENVRQCFALGDYIKKLERDIKFDYITLWDVFEHIREPQKLLSEVKEVMSPSGILYISVPCGAPNPLKVLFAKLRGKEPGLIPWEHVFYYTKPSLRAMLESSGFKVLSLGGVKTYKRPLCASEIIRRIIHKLLAPTRYALQIYVVAELPKV